MTQRCCRLPFNDAKMTHWLRRRSSAKWRKKTSRNQRWMIWSAPELVGEDAIWGPWVYVSRLPDPWLMCRRGTIEYCSSIVSTVTSSRSVPSAYSFHHNWVLDLLQNFSVVHLSIDTEGRMSLRKTYFIIHEYLICWYFSLQSYRKIAWNSMKHGTTGRRCTNFTWAAQRRYVLWVWVGKSLHSSV